jgi:hypothetical protein
MLPLWKKKKFRNIGHRYLVKFAAAYFLDFIKTGTWRLTTQSKKL